MMIHTYTDRFLKQLQFSYDFTDLEIKRFVYTVKAVSSELIKILLLALLFCHLGYLKEFLFGIALLAAIRCNCGGLHMNHFLSCFAFTTVFMLLSVIILPKCVFLPRISKTLILGICMCITFIIGPIASKKRPPAPPEALRRYRNRTMLFLFLAFLFFFFQKTSPYADVCFWIIVLQTIQLMSAKLAQKGVHHEKI